jgi:glycosyltransferase involved in cell wall biosynthesis
VKISFIMTVHNRSRYLRAALQALRPQAGENAEVVIADDGSDPAEFAANERVVGACGLPVRLLKRQRDGFRLAAARNDAIRHSTGDYLFFIDCDILLLRDAVAVHLQRAAPGLFLVGNRALLGQDASGRLLDAELTPVLLDEAWQQADCSEIEAAEQRHRRNAWLRRFGVAKRHKPKLLGCHFSLHRRDIERVNGFDARYVGWGLEDDDLALRLYATGMRSASVIRDARAMHLWHKPGQPATGTGFASANRAYFERRDVEPYCREGLVSGPHSERNG